MPESPNNPTMRSVIERVVDLGDYLEYSRLMRRICPCFWPLGGDIGGHSSPPARRLAVSDIHASDKASRFIAFAIPSITLSTFTERRLFARDRPGAWGVSGMGRSCSTRFGSHGAQADGDTAQGLRGALYRDVLPHLGADQVFAWPTRRSRCGPGLGPRTYLQEGDRRVGRSSSTRGEKMRNTRKASPSLQGGGEGVCR